MILSITGRSGSGKTTVSAKLQELLPDAKPLVSITTRSPRPTDAPGEYRYTSEEEFNRIEAAGEFLWVVGPHGKRFGTRRNDIADALKSPSISIALLAPSVLSLISDEAGRQGLSESLCCIFLDINDEDEVRRRLISRADLPREEIESRLVECRDWKAQAENSSAELLYIDAARPEEEVFGDVVARLKHIRWIS